MDSLLSMLAVARDAALQAGTVLRDHFRTDFRITKKGRIDFVTDLDLRAEKLILGIIRKHYPDHQVLAEEAGITQTVSPFRWIIDPLDGTTNYAHGFPAFCISIAIERDGRVESGVIYDPIANELFSAVRGSGAFMNGDPIKVSDQDSLEESLLGTGFSYNSDALQFNLGLFGQFMNRAAGVRRVGSAARDLAYVACGRFDGVWEFHLNPWDVAAGMLLVEEAGGKVTDFCGEPCGPFDERLLLTNGRIHQAMIDVLRSCDQQ